MHEQLDARLARVAGPVDHALHAVDLALVERERRRLARARAARASAAPARRAARTRPRRRAPPRRDLALLEPARVGLAVRRVHDEQEPIRLELVDDQVVDDPAVLVGQAACTAPSPARSARGRWRAPPGGTRAPAAPRPRARPCATRRTRRSRSAPRGAPGSHPRTARASPSRRTGPSERRARRAGRKAASGAASASALMLKEPGSPPSPRTGAAQFSRRNEGTSRTSSGTSKRSAGTSRGLSAPFNCLGGLLGSALAPRARRPRSRSRSP